MCEAKSWEKEAWEGKCGRTRNFIQGHIAGRDCEMSDRGWRCHHIRMKEGRKREISDARDRDIMIGV